MWKTRVTQLSVKKKKLSSLSCQLVAEEAYTTVWVAMISVVLSNRLSRCARKSENKRTCFDAGWPWGKRKSGFFDLMAFSSEVLIFFALWFSADSRKLISDKFDQWRIRRRCEGTCMHTSTEDRSHTMLRREDFARSILPWRRAPDQRKRSVRRYLYIYIYIYIYIYRDRKPSQHVTVGLAWGSPQIFDCSHLPCLSSAQAFECFFLLSCVGMHGRLPPGSDVFVYGGDQLTRERMSGVQSDRQNAATIMERLGRAEPCFEEWHNYQTYLIVSIILILLHISVWNCASPSLHSLALIFRKFWIEHHEVFIEFELKSLK